jgi:hypothetical protein
MGKVVCSQQCLQSIAFFPFSQNLSNKGKRNMRKKKWKNEQPWTLACTLVLQTMTSPWRGVFFLSISINFPSKMMPCKLNHNLICLCIGSLSIGLETDLKLLTNRNVQFHWTLLLEPLSKVPLTYQYIKLQDPEK